MKIDKLSTHSYRVRKTKDHTTYALYFDHKPTNREIDEQFTLKFAEEPKLVNKGTFREGYEKYIAMKSNVLSPSSIRGYSSIFKRLPESFKRMQMNEITQVDIQTLVNDMAAKLSPKSVRNAHGLISAVLKAFYPQMVIYTTLPQKCLNEPYIPTDDEVRRILEHLRGTEFEIGIGLACMGLRLSEICGASVSDLNGNDLYIHRSKIQNEDNQWEYREHNKTDKSTRHVILPAYLVDLIHSRNEIYSAHPVSLRRALIRAEKELGIQTFTLHTLRHYFATYAHSIGMTDAQIQEMGGWSSDHVMKQVYRRAANMEEAQAKATSHMQDLFKNCQ